MVIGYVQLRKCGVGWTENAELGVGDAEGVAKEMRTNVSSAQGDTVVYQCADREKLVPMKVLWRSSSSILFKKKSINY